MMQGIPIDYEQRKILRNSMPGMDWRHANELVTHQVFTQLRIRRSNGGWIGTNPKVPLSALDDSDLHEIAREMVRERCEVAINKHRKDEAFRKAKRGEAF